MYTIYNGSNIVPDYPMTLPLDHPVSGDLEAATPRGFGQRLATSHGTVEIPDFERENSEHSRFQNWFW